MPFRDRLLIIAACAFILLLASGAVFAEQLAADRTEAPYFFVHRGDVTVELSWTISGRPRAAH